MATLYRCSTPTNYLCRCGTVARALAREGLDASEVRVPQRRARREEVEVLSGQRRVPLLIIDGESICDSRRILEHLEWRRERAKEQASGELVLDRERSRLGGRR